MVQQRPVNLLQPTQDIPTGHDDQCGSEGQRVHHAPDRSHRTPEALAYKTQATQASRGAADTVTRLWQGPPGGRRDVERPSGAVFDLVEFGVSDRIDHACILPADGRMWALRLVRPGVLVRLPIGRASH